MTATTATSATTGINRTLIIVDVQNDFCEGGSLPVTGGTAVATAVTGYLRSGHVHYAAVVATKDWHIDPGGHFSTDPDFVDSWPAHCVAGTLGADPHPELDTSLVQAWFTKGERTAAYSGFQGGTDTETGRISLGDWLTDHDVQAVDVVGIATDHCVRATALDAVAHGLATRVLLDLTAAVAEASTRVALAELTAVGVELIGTAPIG